MTFDLDLDLESYFGILDKGISPCVRDVDTPRSKRRENHAANALRANENLYSPNKHGRQQTISNTNEIKRTDKKITRSSLQI